MVELEQRNSEERNVDGVEVIKVGVVIAMTILERDVLLHDLEIDLI